MSVSSTCSETTSERPNNVYGRQPLFFGESILLLEVDSPCLRAREPHGLVAPYVGIVEEHAKIVKATLQTLDNSDYVSAVQTKAHPPLIVLATSLTLMGFPREGSVAFVVLLNVLLAIAIETLGPLVLGLARFPFQVIQLLVPFVIPQILLRGFFELVAAPSGRAPCRSICRSHTRRPSVAIGHVVRGGPPRSFVRSWRGMRLHPHSSSFPR